MAHGRWYYSVDASTVLEITNRVRLPVDPEGVAIGVGAHAEEGSGWEGTIEVDDPTGSLIMLMGRRIYCVQEHEAAGSQVVGNWFISNLDVERMDPFSGAARKWIVTMADENSLLERRIFVGIGNDRPAETDIARIRWLLTTTELNTVDRDEAFIDTSDPVDMDAVDYIGQKPSQVMSDVSQQSGKNFWIKYGEAAAVGGAIVSSSVANPTVITTTTAHGLTSGMSVVIAGHTGSTPTINGTRVVTVTGATTFTIPVNVTVGGTGGTTTTIGRYQLCYFDFNTSDLYPSAIGLSNVAADIDSVTTYAISDDSRLSRAGGRAPTSGMYLPYAGGYVYEQDTAVGDTYVYRDVAAPSVNVKTAAKATARAERLLAELDEPDDEIETEIIVQAAALNDAMHGMLIPFRASHFPNFTEDSNRPGYAVGTNARIMRRQVRQIGPTTFGNRLWLTPVFVAVCSTESVDQFYDEEKQPVQASQQTFNVPAPTDTPSVIVAILSLMAEAISVGPSVEIDTSGAWNPLDNYEVELGQNVDVVIDTAYQPYTSGTPEALVGNLAFVQGTQYYTDWLVVAVSVATASTSPVQKATSVGESAGSVTLPAPPTPGNILVMFETVQDEATEPPNGWTQIAQILHGEGGLVEDPGPGDSGVYVFACCVIPGMSATINIQPLGAGIERHMFVSEWTP